MYWDSEGPDLVVIVIGTCPGLHLVAICHNTIFQIRAEASVFERNAVISRIKPLLRREIIVTLPYLELYAICRICTGVKTEVGPSDLHLRAAFVDDPTLRLGAIAIIYLDGCSVGKNGTSNIQTFVLEVIEMNGLSLVGELACGAESYIIIGVCNIAPIVRRRWRTRCSRRKPGRRLRKCLWTTTAVALNCFTKSVAWSATLGLDLKTGIGMVWIRNHVIIVVAVEARPNGSLGSWTSTISIRVEEARTSTEGLHNISICRNRAVLHATNV